jgi:adenylosuccinate synthase
MRAYIVVGAGYGDEGKGLATDWLCSQALAQGRNPMVVRANGGTQAAHTVITPQGERHVFNHHGSGSFLGVPTYLSQHFLLNPIGFKTEREAMPATARAAKVWVDQQAVTALPVDMMLNQMMEQRRGAGKHGSCGWGIGETVERNQTNAWRVCYADLCRGNLGVTEIYRITKEYLEYRLPKLGVAADDPVLAQWHSRLHDGSIIERWLADAEYMVKHTHRIMAREVELYTDTLVFEGAQGLGLDQDGPHFPHVTRSHTGSTNPIDVCQRVGVSWVEALYVTRCYATRHGAGPLEHEGKAHGCTVVDPTNTPNQWQDAIRSAPLDLDLTVQRISRDALALLRAYPEARMGLLMTCMDQAGPEFCYEAGFAGQVPDNLSHEDKPNLLQGRIAGGVELAVKVQGQDFTGTRLLTSWGPTRADVHVIMQHEGNMMQRLQSMQAQYAELTSG